MTQLKKTENGMMESKNIEPEGKDLEILNYLKDKKTYKFITDKVEVSRSRITKVKKEFLDDSTDSTTKSTANSTTKKEKSIDSNTREALEEVLILDSTDSTDSTLDGPDEDDIEIPIPIGEIKSLIRSAKSKWSHGKGKYPNMEVIIDNVIKWTVNIEKKEVKTNAKT